jgi:hypothetical protein
MMTFEHLVVEYLGSPYHRWSGVSTNITNNRPEDVQRILGALGGDGWELVSVVAVSRNEGQTDDYRYFLKRRNG